MAKVLAASRDPSLIVEDVRQGKYIATQALFLLPDGLLRSLVEAGLADAILTHLQHTDMPFADYRASPSTPIVEAGHFRTAWLEAMLFVIHPAHESAIGPNLYQKTLVEVAAKLKPLLEKSYQIQTHQHHSSFEHVRLFGDEDAWYVGLTYLVGILHNLATSEEAHKRGFDADSRRLVLELVVCVLGMDRVGGDDTVKVRLALAITRGIAKGNSIGHLKDVSEIMGSMQHSASVVLELLTDVERDAPPAGWPVEGCGRITAEGRTLLRQVADMKVGPRQNDPVLSACILDIAERCQQAALQRGGFLLLLDVFQRLLEISDNHDDGGLATFKLVRIFKNKRIIAGCPGAAVPVLVGTYNSVHPRYSDDGRICRGNDKSCATAVSAGLLQALALHSARNPNDARFLEVAQQFLRMLEAMALSHKTASAL